MPQFKRVITAFALVVVAGFARPAGATTIDLTIDLNDPYALGMVVNGIQAGGQVARDVIMVNNLLDTALGGTQIIGSAGDDTYSRSSNNFGTLPTAVDTGAVPQVFADLTVNSTNSDLMTLTLSGAYAYLLAAYDGPNGGSMVWYIGDIAAGTTLNFDRYAIPTADNKLTSGAAGNKYQLTGITFLNSVPDSGTTSMLLGISLLGLGYVRRFLA